MSLLKKIGIAEIFLAQVAVYLALWLFIPFLAALLSAVFAGVFLMVLLISLIAEWVERSKTPRWYFQFMLASTLAPLLAAAIFWLIGSM
jgi:hypothetical protein